MLSRLFVNRSVGAASCFLRSAGAARCLASAATMKALVFHGPHKKSFDTVPKPIIQKPTDALIRITKTTICGTDLHILKGDVPTVVDGRTLGHEAIGIVEETGTAVSNFKKGDKVIMSCITSCGKCDYCKQQMYSHCEDGGWILGHLVNGVQAEYVRIPHADNSLHHIPEQAADDAMVMIADILPTAFEMGVQYGKVKPGQTVAIVGAGPIGLSAIMTAKFYSPSKIIVINTSDPRLAVAKEMGATHIINSKKQDAVKEVMAMTKDGVDVAIECVGVPNSFDVCQKIVRPGGHIANVGVHGKPVEFDLDRLWIQNITLTTGLVNTNTIPMLKGLTMAGQLHPETLATHHFKLSEIMHAYDIFSNASQNNALKIVLENDISQ